MNLIRYTPLVRDTSTDQGYRAEKRDSAVAGANLVIGVEPFRWGRYGTCEGATILFIDGQQRHVDETVEQIVARLEAAATVSNQ
jgi:hypothetical protein